MGDGNDGAGEGVQILFQPLDGLGVEVVGGLVQKQDVGRLQKQPAQGHAAPLAARDLGHGHVPWRAAQGVHGHVEARIQIPEILGVHFLLHLGLALDEGVHGIVVHGFGKLGVDVLELLDNGLELGNAVLDHLAHGARLAGQRLLLQVAYGVARGEHGLAVELLVDAGKDLQQAGLACAVEAQNADLGAVEVGKGDVLQHFLLTVAFGNADHGVDNLVRFVAQSCLAMGG